VDRWIVPARWIDLDQIANFAQTQGDDAPYFSVYLCGPLWLMFS
jgi:hypothetical protein